MPTLVGRRKYSHPSLGAAGGSALHAAIELIYTTISNDGGGRFFAMSAVANSTVIDFEHNFGVDDTEVSYALFLGSHPALSKVADPTGSGWTIVPTPGFEKTKTRLTAPSSGGPHTFVLWVFQKSGGSGGSSGTMTQVSTNQTISTGTGDVAFDMTTGALDKTVTLPAVAANSGRRVTITKADLSAGKVILDGAGAETINGATTAEVAFQYGFLTVQSNGTEWRIVG